MKICVFNQIDGMFHIVDEDGSGSFGMGKTEAIAWKNYESLKKVCLSLKLAR